MTTATTTTATKTAKAVAKASAKAKERAKAKKAKPAATSGSRPTPTTAPTAAAPRPIEAEGFASSSPFFSDLANDHPYVSAALLGGPKTGKTRGGCEILVAVVKACGIDTKRSPVVVVENEGKRGVIAARLAASGIRAVARATRSLADVSEAFREAERIGACALFVDGVTPIWEDLLESHKLAQTIERLGPSDWSTCKALWHKHWSVPLARARMHVVFTVRPAFDYDVEVDDQGRTTTVKGTMKMRGEAELAHDPATVFEMSVVDVGGVDVRRARIRDAHDLLDGKTFDNLSAGDLLDFVRAVTADGVDAPVAESAPASSLFSEAGRDRRTFDAALGEVRGLLDRIAPTQSAHDKARRTAALSGAFATAVWSEIESMRLERIRLGADLLRRILADGGILDLAFVRGTDVAARVVTVSAAADFVDMAPNDAIAERAVITSNASAAVLADDALPDEVRTEAQARAHLAAERLRARKGSGGAAPSGTSTRTTND